MCSSSRVLLTAGYLALLTAYVGTLGQAVGARREFGGMMSKPWRMVALHIGSWLTFALFVWGEGRVRGGGLTVFDWTCLLRLRRIFLALAKKGEPR
jgi:hypothetical protein